MINIKIYCSVFTAESKISGTKTLETRLKATIGLIEKYLTNPTFQQSSTESQNAVQKALALLRQLADLVDQGTTEQEEFIEIQNGLEEVKGLLPDWLRELLVWLEQIWCFIQSPAFPFPCFY